MAIRMAIGALTGAGIGWLLFWAIPGIGFALPVIGGFLIGGALGSASVLPGKTAPMKDVDSDRHKAMNVREEVLDIRKEQIKTGEVTVRTEVTEEQQTIQVSVKRQEVVIEFHDEQTGENRAPIRIPVKEERVEVVKIPVDLEKVDVKKRSVERLIPVTEAVQKEVARVEVEGAAIYREEPPQENTDNRL